MDAMLYEVMIRQAHQVKRYGVDGANADIYRSFERAWSLYDGAKNKKEKYSTKSLEELAADAYLNLGIVATHVRNSIDYALKKYKSTLSDEQYEKLEDSYSLILFPDKEKVDQAIRQASDIFSEINLLG